MELHAAWLENHARTKQEFIDGMQNSILVVEIRNSTIDWDEPRDLSLEDLLARIGLDEPDTAGSFHVGCNVLFADGASGWFSLDDTDRLRKMLLVNDGEGIRGHAYP